MMAGGIARLNALNLDFYDRVASRYGLLPGVRRCPARAKREVAAEVLERMVESRDPATTSRNWAAIRSAIEDSPFDLAEKLQIDTGRRQKKRRSMTDIFISKGKGPTKEQTPRRFAVERAEHLSCVGVRHEQTDFDCHSFVVPAAACLPDGVDSNTPTSQSGRPEATSQAFSRGIQGQGRYEKSNAALEAAIEPQSEGASDLRGNELTNCRDTDFAADTWDEETGEFLRPAARARQSPRATADWHDEFFRGDVQVDG
jgi:hypothetical protein